MQKGDVVLVPFPFTDLSGVKIRPAVVAANVGGDDLILCQVTSRFRDDGYSIALADSDFVSGKLDRNSYGYFVSTIRNVSREAVEYYIRNQG